ncbi:glycosyltransferase family 39 protein [bacterium]|nr:glycosyltransferase family 39 protein [bacterium]
MKTFSASTKNYLKKIPVTACLLILLSGVLFTLRIHQESIWNDEWFTVNNISQQGLKAVIKEIVFTENTPPAYFLLLKGWALGGYLTNIVWLRLFSVLFAVLSVWGIYLLAESVTESKVTALIASFLSVVSPYVLWYAQEMRNGTFAMFLAIFMMYYFRKYCYTDKKKYFYLSLFFQLTGLFTHYYFIFFIPAQIIYLYLAPLKAKRKKWWAAIFVMIFLFVLWVPFLWEQVSMNRSGWLPKPSLYFPIRVIASFSAGYFFPFKERFAIVPAVICALLFIIGLGYLVFDKKRIILSFNYRSGKIFILVFFIVPVLLAFCVSFIKPIVFGGRRYLIIVLPLFFIAVSQGLISLKSKKIISLFLSIITFFNILFMIDIYANHQKRRWDKASFLIKKYAVSGDCVFSTDYTDGKILSYYGIGKAELVHTKDIMLVKKTVRPYKRVWYISTTTNLPQQSVLASFMQEVFAKQIQTSIGDCVWITLYKNN